MSMQKNLRSMDLLKQYYTTVFAQEFSPCGKYLAAGNNYGKIAIFNISSFFIGDDTVQLEESRHPMYKYTAHNSSIYALTTTDKFLISGGIGDICGWSWSDIKKKEAKVLWTLTITQGESLTKPEVNSMIINPKNGRTLLYAGCGDNKIYIWDLEHGSLLRTFEGHTDYIQCVTLSSTGQECLSGSEDGSVRLWDTRKSGKAVQCVEPYKYENLHRPRFGKWIGCVALDNNDDWMVCGGGPTLCVWHVRSLSPATPLYTPEATNSVAIFHDDVIISGGSQPYVCHWSFGGEIKAEIPTSASGIYSIAICAKSNQKVLSAGGTSHKIDVSTNFMYRDFSLIFS